MHYRITRTVPFLKTGCLAIWKFVISQAWRGRKVTLGYLDYKASAAVDIGDEEAVGIVGRKSEGRRRDERFFSIAAITFV